MEFRPETMYEEEYHEADRRDHSKYNRRRTGKGGLNQGLEYKVSCACHLSERSGYS